MARTNGGSGITAGAVLEMIERQGYRCALSGRKLTPESASIDHVVPLAKGGAHSIENLWVVENVINSAKGTLTVEEFVSMCRDVVRHMEQQANREIA